VFVPAPQNYCQLLQAEPLMIASVQNSDLTACILYDVKYDVSTLNPTDGKLQAGMKDHSLDVHLRCIAVRQLESTIAPGSGKGIQDANSWRLMRL
jgi:hypothetical protein